MSVEAIAVCLHHSRAAKTDKLVLLGIANHDGDGGAWPSVATLARYANCSERHVQRAIANLVDLGELQVVRQRGGNEGTRADRRPNLYRVRVSCPPNCDGSTQHRLRGDAGDTPFDGATKQAQRGDISDTHGVTPVSPEPSLEPSDKPLAATPRNQLFDAIATACEWNTDTLTRTARGQLNKAVKELHEAGATTDQVAGKAKAYRKQWPGMTLTPTALVKHWAALEDLTTPKRKSVWETYERPEWY